MNAGFWRICAASAGSAVIALAAWVLPAAAARQSQDSSQSTGDAVADAARKAREQKAKDTTKPKRVYTDEDVRHAVPPNEPANANPAESDATKNAEGENAKAPGATDKGVGGKTGETKENPEAVWRKKFKDAYANLARAEKELDILQREDNKAQLQYYSDPQKAMTEQYTRQEINEKNTKIAAKKDEVAQLKQKISDMEEDLRKAGGDPGWATP